MTRTLASMSSPRISRYRLLVTGRLPKTVTDVVADRFEPAVIQAEEGRTVVDVDADQASLRALLTLLWDIGQDVSSVSRCADLPEATAG
jgi:hypothetical protein